MNSVELGTATPLAPDTSETTASETVLPTSKSSLRFSKDAIRTSLKPSTVDAFFTTVFSITTVGILMSNFLVEIGASPAVFGILSSIPMLVNLIQPLGAILSDRSTSRFWYSCWTYGISRIVWVILAIGIAGASLGLVNNHQLLILTLIILLLSNLLNAIGYASWMSWLAIIVPRRLRGRYFGLRNSIASLTNLLCIPLAGFAVSTWPGGTLQGYGVIVFVGVLCGVVSMVCQYFKVDINPQLQNASVVNFSQKGDTQPESQPLRVIASTPAVPAEVLPLKVEEAQQLEVQESAALVPTSPRTQPVSSNQLQQSTADQPLGIGPRILKNSNFLLFLSYFGVWMLAMNLSVPFFSLYMLDRLDLDVSLVSLYASIQAGANLLMLIVWGKLADRFGNRQILTLVGVLVIATPLLWLKIGNDAIDIWLWLPLIHVFIGGTWAALDLCNNNLQIGVAPIQNQAIYFSLVAASGGVSGALGSILGGFIAQNPAIGGIAGLFAVSSVFRFLALIPLIFIQEQGRESFFQTIQAFWQSRKQEEVKS